MKVLKFGGSSVANPERIKAIVQIVKPRLAQEKIAIVFSAFGGVTDTLIQMSEHALASNDQYKEQLAQLEKRHLDAVRALVSMQKQSAVLAQVKFTINELEDILHGIFLVKERTPRSLDYIMSFGERLSAFVIAEALKDEGIDAEFLDARRVVRTDHQFGYARVNFVATNRMINDHFSNTQKLQVITGFIGSSENGETTTLGRSGSDYTAAIFAGALKSESVEIWTDVDGMMTADPRKVKKAFSVKEMTYEEAMELSHFGAKVIFPATMQPAMANQIPIWIKNTFNPQHPGTCISNNANGKALIIKGISSMSNISLLNVQGSGLMGVVGVSMRLFATLAREKINVILISQASSEHSICFAIESGLAMQAKQAIEKEFQYEILNREMNAVTIEDSCAIVAIVGENMKHNPGTSGRMFGALGKNGVNVRAIAQGSSELNISAVIHQSDVGKALNALHEAFFLSDRKVLNVFLVGTGLIGKELLHMMHEQFDQLANQHRLEVNVIAIANSKKMLFAEEGLRGKMAVDRMTQEGLPMNLQEFVIKMQALNLPNSVFVDCTSSEAVANAYSSILESNISIVTPNKKANSGSWANYQLLKKTSRQRGVKFLYETNVGAGLPVINTLNDLLISGDKVIRVEAVLSGTLNFIFSSFGAGKKFSGIVLQAKEKGFTEPDPRDDLNGMDVARKVLILSREIGYELELADVEVHNLVPESLRAETSIQKFLSSLPATDQLFEDLREKADKENKKLRYMAIIEGGKAKVSLVAVDAAHPFYSLSGSDNIILLTTERYHERPMVIRGPGAGATVTAAGVFADVIRIGNYSI
ncbi:MAG: bifunctional aspartate kinase/homoserine dehydrogenase I [Bacteroidota bacterium]|jgi:aspartokinase/homoserine dehydrogenase 1|nr:bifunctional aspartate kinase/homoserine dehydrogenase I [Flammeovirgaceae bacterium]MCZ8070666.1 bifunctional aspartate kinase/homoserine dehydrogenase I [Cytophagales bacterium]